MSLTSGKNHKKTYSWHSITGNHVLPTFQINTSMIQKLTKIISLTICLALFHYGFISAQTIDNMVQNDISSVGQDISNLTIQVSGTTPGTTYDIHVFLNSQGIEMINTGANMVSVNNGTLGTIGGTITNPIIPITASATDFELIVPRIATCATYDLLSAGTAVAFNDQAQIGAGGSLFTPPANYQVNYAALSITKITDSSNSISPSSTVNRSVKIVQGLPGSLSEFYVDISDIDGFLGFSNIELKGSNTISIPSGQITISPNQHIVQITSADILAAGIGNGDGLFDLNESILLDYDLFIDNGCPSGSNISVRHFTYWGVIGNTSSTAFCQKNNALKVISFSEELPNLNITIDSTDPDTCLGYNSGSMTHTVTFKNNGSADLLDLSFSIRGETNDYNVFDAGNITYSLDGAAPTLIATTTSVDVTNDAGCFSSIPGGLDLKTEAKLDIPISIPPNGSIDIVFQSYACCPTACVSEYNAHGFKLRNITFAEVCGSTLTTSNRSINTSSMNWSSLFTAPTNFFTTDPTQYGSIDILAGNLENLLLATDATFELVVSLPGGIDIGDPSEIGWTGLINPGTEISSNIDVDNGFTISWPADILEYQGGSISFPMILDCSESLAGSLDVNLYLKPKNDCLSGVCEISLVCESVNIALGCPGVCTSGMSHETYAFYRKNIDIADADNNGCPDTDNDCDGILANTDTDETTPPAFDSDKVRTTRAVEGDTIISEIIATVKIQAGDPEFRRIMIIDQFLDNANRNKFNFVSAEIYYADFDTGLNYTENVVNGLSSGQYNYKLKPDVWALNNATHRFQDGDTLKATITYIMGPNTSTLETRSVVNYVYGYTQSNFTSTPYGCTDFAGSIAHIPVNIFTINKSDINIDGCKAVDIISDIRFNMGNTANVQFFPYEYRQIGFVDSFAVRIPDGFNYSDAAITIERYNHSSLDTVSVNHTQIISGVGFNDYIFDLQDPINSHVLASNGGSIFPGDETYTFKLIANVYPDCDVTNNVLQDFDPNNEATFAKVIKEQYHNTDGILILDISRNVKPRLSNLGISSLSQIESFSSNNIEWGINIKNNDNNGVADKVWALVETSSTIDPNSVTFFRDDAGTLTEITANANGLYELGSIDTKESISYQIGAEILFCQYDSITIFVGERCGGYPTSIIEAKEKCFEEFTAFVEPKDAQVSSIITPLSSTLDPEDGITSYANSEINMCAPFPIEILVVSGQIEPIDGISLSVPSLGNGLEYVAGSGYIWYDRNGDDNLDPDGANDIDEGGAGDDERIPFDATQDGILSANNGSGNNYLFNIKELTDGSGLFDWNAGQYLPGVTELPKNILRVRFEMQTTCEIVSGTPITVQTFAQKALCGGSAFGDGEFRSGFNLNIAGAAAPYTAGSSSISQSNILTCGSAQTIDFSFTKSGVATPSTEDSIVVFLPTGLNYDSFGSNTGDQSISTNPNITSTAIGQYIKWQIPAALGDNESVNFSINAIPASTACSTYEIRMEVQTSVSINCGGTPCPGGSRIVLGDAAEMIDVELPNFEVILNTIDHIAGTQFDGNLDLSNIGLTDFNDDLSIELYRYDGAGEIIGSVLNTVNAGNIMNGASKNVNFSFSTIEDISMGVVAIIPNVGDNCYCGMPDVAARSMNNTPSSVATPTLPIDLISFKVTEKDCQVSLEWITAKEDNFSHFEVIRSNNITSERIVIHEVEGQYPNGGTYTFVDDSKLPTSKYYYQLRSIDLDESFEYSGLAAASIDCGASEITVIPNPVRTSGEITILFSTQYEEELIQIINTSGKIVKSFVQSTTIGEQQQISLNLDGLAPSIYFVKTSSGISTKFVLIK